MCTAPSLGSLITIPSPVLAKSTTDLRTSSPTPTLVESAPVFLSTIPPASAAAFPRSYSGSALTSSATAARTPQHHEPRSPGLDNQIDTKSGKDTAFNLLLTTEKFIHHLEGSPSSSHHSPGLQDLHAHVLSDYQQDGLASSGDGSPRHLIDGGAITVSPRGNKVYKQFNQVW